MQTVFTTNNAYDTILLVDDNDTVVSRWEVDRETLNNYLKDGARPDEWHIGEWPSGFDPDMEQDEQVGAELRSIATYGKECGRNGVITDPDRQRFWIREEVK